MTLRTAHRLPRAFTRGRPAFSLPVAAPCLLLMMLAGIPRSGAQATLTLHDAVQQAMNSPAAQIAQAQVGVAEAQRRQANLGLKPRLYLQSEDLHPWDNGFSFANSTEDYGYFSQTLELAGKRARRTALADDNLHRAQAERDLRTTQIAGVVAVAYWTAAGDTRIVDLLKQDLAAVDAMVRYHQARVDAGAMRGVDLIRMQIERDRVYLALQTAQRDADIARTELFKQIGRPTDSAATLSDDLTATDGLPELDLNAALAQRIEITIARDAVAAAEADLKLQHANAVPDPELFAGYKRDVGANTAYAALQIPLPFRNRNQGEIQRAQAQLSIAKATLQQTEISVRADIEAATANYRRELAIVHGLLPDMRARAKQNLDIFTEAYRIGGVDLLRYIDAERTNLDVEVTAIKTLAEYHQAALRLQLAYGAQP